MEKDKFIIDKFGITINNKCYSWKKIKNNPTCYTHHLIKFGDYLKLLKSVNAYKIK